MSRRRSMGGTHPTTHLTPRQEPSQPRGARLYRGRRTGTRSRSARDDLGAADGADGRAGVFHRRAHVPPYSTARVRSPMPIDAAKALAAEPRTGEITWTAKDVQLYHLGIGAGV